MYIFIFKGEEPKISDKVTQDDIELAEDGVLEIIRISDNKRYFLDGEWIDMKTWGS